MVNKAREDRELTAEQLCEALRAALDLVWEHHEIGFIRRAADQITGTCELCKDGRLINLGKLQESAEAQLIARHCTAESAPRKCPTCGHEKAETCSICDHFTFEGKCHLSACRCESCGRTARAESALDSAPPTQPPPLSEELLMRKYTAACNELLPPQNERDRFWNNGFKEGWLRCAHDVMLAAGLSEAAPEKETK